jgi:hypothetical protein
LYLPQDLLQLTGGKSILAAINESKRILPSSVTSNLHRMIFAVADKMMAPKGISFFVRPTVAVTAFHVLLVHYPSIKPGDSVPLLRESDLVPHAGTPQPIMVTLGNFNLNEDWALMHLPAPQADVIPFTIGDATDAQYYPCQLLAFNIALTDVDALTEAEDLQKFHITHTVAMPRSLEPLTFSYTSVSHCGDSGGAVVASENGQVIAIHCDFTHSMKKSVKSIKQLYDEISSGASQGIGSGIRLDVLQTRGLFD